MEKFMSSLDKLIKKFQQSLHLLPALRLVWQGAPNWTAAQVVILIFQGTLPLVLLYLTKLIVDTAVVSINAADKATAFRQVAILLGLTAVVTLANICLTSLGELVNTAQSQRVTDYMHGILHAKSIEIDLEFYENAQYHDALQRAQQEAPYRPNQILQHLIQLAQDSISLVAMVGLLLTLHWGIAGILFVAAVPAGLVRVKFANVMYQWHRQRTALERQGEYLNWLLTGDIFAKEIRLFDLGALFNQRFDRIRGQLYKETLAIARKRTIATLGAQALASILIFIVYGFIIYQTIQGILRIGDLVLYYQAFQRGQDALKGLLGSISGLYEDNLFLSNLYEFLELKPKILQPANPKPIPQPMQTGIEFKNVGFQYTTTTRKALKNINLKIKPGQVVALVGENGSGKTTLIKLLCRLYDPTSGSITIDGIDIRSFEIANLRRQISVIFQDYVKYNFTANENIWLGNIELSPTEENITAAARRSGADQVINSLPQGYNTILGKLFEDGEELSIGQWQKVALARAFLRKSQVIVLDEPTSAMDPLAEDEVFQKFRQLIKGQAAILISHRLSTVKMADCIYAIANGSIVESGTHSELIQLGGVYANLFETQAQYYR
jgi:ATP-binding cassette subfamily B protein